MLRASRWLWLHAEDYGMDEDRLYVSGHSAGGHLTAMMMARALAGVRRAPAEGPVQGRPRDQRHLRPAAAAAGRLAERRPAPGRGGGARALARLPAAGDARAGDDLRRRRRELGVPAPERAARRALAAACSPATSRCPARNHFSVLDGLAEPVERAVRRRAPADEARPMKEYLAAGALHRQRPSGRCRLFAGSILPERRDRERAVSLYYAVRDGIRYNPFLDFSTRGCFRASACLEAGEGFCVGKAALLAACARADGIPARVGFADVKNHLTTPRAARDAWARPVRLPRLHRAAARRANG